ncbi:hypothetical protein [Shinella zoogloeoides]|uniref:Uncharacterized protein n=1 Tax=Shinella zoogloeoides TaxID=352475 RepID=A0A6N8TPB9_SHIZO|nr:hypothetical protein [Shinella zoogloeoides]MXO03088.1 hypothetical protein [Shinella zoogloeoides]
MLQELAGTTSKINELLTEPWMDAGREGPSPLDIISGIFGRDIRAGGGLNPLTDDQIEALIPEAKACLNTLRTLQNFGMFPPAKPWASFKLAPR